LRSVSVGVTVALAAAGWPLYSLVAAGQLDPATAVVRGVAVAVACTLGAEGIERLVRTYEREAKIAKRRQLESLFDTMKKASADGALATDAAGTDSVPGAAPAETPPAPGASNTRR
jgi:hypothetical protein